MEKLIFNSEFFSARDTLDCGQIFRYTPENAGYLVFSADKACLLTTEGDKTTALCDDAEYFKNYFDAERDYGKIHQRAINFGNPFLKKAADVGKGIRILRQDTEEMLFSFIVSQNNNIPRIKGIIDRLCKGLGKPIEFMGERYFSFPKATDIAQKPPEFYKSIGLGYRAEYLPAVADALQNGFDLCQVAKLSTPDLKKELIKLKGVGPKVADCVILFGFGRGDSFPVDTWIEKIYKEDFKGDLTDRNKIADYFVSSFGEYAGFYQQYVFHYKRNVLDK